MLLEVILKVGIAFILLVAVGHILFGDYGNDDHKGSQ
jgi:hypothetical protein